MKNLVHRWRLMIPVITRPRWVTVGRGRHRRTRRRVGVTVRRLLKTVKLLRSVRVIVTCFQRKPSPLTGTLIMNRRLIKFVQKLLKFRSPSRLILLLFVRRRSGFQLECFIRTLPFAFILMKKLMRRFNRGLGKRRSLNPRWSQSRASIRRTFLVKLFGKPSWRQTVPVMTVIVALVLRSRRVRGEITTGVTRSKVASFAGIVVIYCREGGYVQCYYLCSPTTLRAYLSLASLFRRYVCRYSALFGYSS